MVFGNDYEKKMMSDINITPFVDVMLVLLIIFMVTAPLMTQGVDVNLPDTESAIVKSS
ncbi:MAG: biopolymer transporter ExbD, partial [Deltaproteobacteria bacterium]|nr:biopolymer transporter ExbD [Deltaproteobacteria bacterium]